MSWWDFEAPDVKDWLKKASSGLGGALKGVVQGPGPGVSQRLRESAQKITALEPQVTLGQRQMPITGAAASTGVDFGLGGAAAPIAMARQVLPKVVLDVAAGDVAKLWQRFGLLKTADPASVPETLLPQFQKAVNEFGKLIKRSADTGKPVSLYQQLKISDKLIRQVKDLPRGEGGYFDPDAVKNLMQKFQEGPPPGPAIQGELPLGELPTQPRLTPQPQTPGREFMPDEEAVRQFRHMQLRAAAAGQQPLPNFPPTGGPEMGLRGVPTQPRLGPVGEVSGARPSVPPTPQEAAQSASYLRMAQLRRTAAQAPPGNLVPPSPVSGGVVPPPKVPVQPALGNLPTPPTPPTGGVRRGIERLEGARLGLMVSQPATQLRNFWSQIGRLGIEVADEATQAALQKVTGKAVTVSPVEGLGALGRIFSLREMKGAWKFARGEETSPVFQALGRAFPEEVQRAFARYSSDIEGNAEKIVNTINTHSRFQEFLTRRAIIGSHLDWVLKKKGTSLAEVVKKNDLWQLEAPEVKAAVDKALKLTFAADPTDPMGRALVGAIKATTPIGGRLFIPFPRFIANSLRFQYEFSPVGLAHGLFSPSGWAKIQAGNMEEVSRGLIGSAMFLSAYAFRNSQWAGEKWYEAKEPGTGKLVDLRAYAPFASYLFLADALDRVLEGRTYGEDLPEWVRSITGIDFRGATGLTGLEAVVERLTSQDPTDQQQALKSLENLLGEYASSFLTPLNAVNDIFGQFDEESRTSRIEEGVGRVVGRIPGARTTLPPVYNPTAKGTVQREQPIFRQAVGQTYLPSKNPAQKELDRLQFKYREILPATGSREADNLLAKHLGTLVETQLSRYVSSAAYNRLPDNQKSALLREKLIDIRAKAREAAKKENPRLFKQIAATSAPLRERMGATR